MSDLTPITREEMILNGEDLTPITRLEYFLKKAAEGGGGSGGSSIVVIEGTKNSAGTTVTLNKSFSEIKALIEDGNMPIIAVTGLPYAGKNYYVLYNKYDGSTFNEQVNFIFSGTDCKYNSTTNVLEIKNICLGLDETEGYIARVINNNEDISIGGSGSDCEFIELTNAEYNLLTQQQKQDSSKLYFINDIGVIEMPFKVNINRYINKKENSMNISLDTTDDILIYTYTSGAAIGCYSKLEVQSGTKKIKYKILTGTSYYNGNVPKNDAFKLAVAVSNTNKTNFFPYTDNDLYGVALYDQDNGKFEGEIDLESLTGLNLNQTVYFYITAPGWNIRAEVDEVKEVDGEQQCIIYKDIIYYNSLNSGVHKLTKTLVQGQTTLLFESSIITTDSLIDVYPANYGIMPIDMTINNGSCLLTFTAQSFDLGVTIKIS